MIELNDEQQQRLETYKTRPRSYSQTRQWHECGYGFLLARIVRAPEMRGAWLEQGVSVHEVVEAYEKSGRSMTDSQVRSMYRERYSTMVNKSLSVQPKPDMWFSSGPYKGLPSDIERRYKVGQDQVSAYLAFCESNPKQQVWNNSVERKFEIDLDGVTVIGFIDLLIDHPKYETVVRDVKTGQKPDEHSQLNLYKLAVNETLDLDVGWGDYWLGKTGRTSRMIKLSMERSHFVEWFATMDAGVKAGEFRPNPGAACERCPVQLTCQYKMDA